jgi:hypothetical protein
MPYNYADGCVMGEVQLQRYSYSHLLRYRLVSTSGMGEYSGALVTRKGAEALFRQAVIVTVAFSLLQAIAGALRC